MAFFIVEKCKTTEINQATELLISMYVPEGRTSQLAPQVTAVLLAGFSFRSPLPVVVPLICQLLAGENVGVEVGSGKGPERSQLRQVSMG